MNQQKNKLSYIYNFNNETHCASIYFDINEKNIIMDCSCNIKHFCRHIDYLIDYIFNSYFNYEKIGNEHILNIYQNENKLWLPVSETDNDITVIIDMELLYYNKKFYYHCSNCSQNDDEITRCNHLDYIIDNLKKHYQKLKNSFDDVSNISLDSLNISNNNEDSMEY